MTAKMPVSNRTKFLDSGGRMRSPTPLQKKLFHYLAQGMSRRSAMLKAGYSLSMANSSTGLFKSPQMKKYMSSVVHIMEKNGIDKEYIAKKFGEWFEAEKHVTSHTEPDKMLPDYDIQLKAYDRYKTLEESASARETDGKKISRKITVEDFIYDTPQEAEVIKGEDTL